MDDVQFKDESSRTRSASNVEDADEFGTISTTGKKLTDSNDAAPGLSRAAAEQDFSFIGLLGIYDPPRAETRAAVEACKRAGIVVHMLTGDHPATAHAIAKEVAIVDGTEGASAVMTAAPVRWSKRCRDRCARRPSLGRRSLLACYQGANDCCRQATWPLPRHDR